MKTVAVVQARMGASRLPGKMMLPLGNQPVLAWSVRAAQAITGVNQVAVATSTAAGDDPIAAWCAEAGVVCVRGSEEDVLSRFVAAAEETGADRLLRLTGDCPLLDPVVCGQVLMLLALGDADYASNVDPATWPDGLDCEAFTATALREADSLAGRASDREHVTPFIRNNRIRYRVANLPCGLPGLAAERWTLDTPEDLDFLRRVVEKLPQDRPSSHLEVLAVLQADPDLRAGPAREARNQGFEKSLRVEREKRPAVERSQRSFDRSSALLARAEKTIPLGSQTFSKSRVQFPVGAAPLFLTHGEGGRVWDVDGNEYVDMVNGLLCVLLGYRDPDVNEAIRRQMDRGISFSLATELEAELAERLVEIIPCAEQVRFAKNGSDATSAAVRIARAHTGRDHVAVCGYHGWQDWYIGSTSRNLGVPDAVRGLTTPLPYNDLAAAKAFFEAHPGEVAAIVMEPMNVVVPEDGYLAALKELAHANGALLVFDEIITGFRFGLGGAQEYLGVTPDLAAFGKGMANGMPLSAVVGRADLLGLMEQVFVSGTFGGEALSLAAAIAVIDKMKREPVVETLWRNGDWLNREVSAVIESHDLSESIKLLGLAPWNVLSIGDAKTAGAQEIKTMLIYELADRGVLTVGSHNLSYAQGAEDLAQVVSAYDGALEKIRQALDSGRFADHLKVPALEPVFKVR